MSETLTAALQSAETPVQDTAPETPVETQGGPESLDYVGFTPDDAVAQTETEAQFKLAENLPPDTVIGYSPDGKPITAQEVTRSFLRESDYTKKTQAIAEQAKEIQAYKEWIEENRPYLERLNSGDPEQIVGALQDFAQQVGVADRLSPRARDDAGRFAKSEGLNPDEWGDEARPVVEALNQSQSKLSALEKKFDQLMSGLQSVQQQTEARDAMTQMALQWKANGMNADVDGAMQLVGKPMTPEQALRLHNLDAMIRHTYNVTKAKAGAVKPNEPGGGASRPAGDSPMSLTERLRHGITN